MVQSSTIDYEAMVRRYMDEWQGKNLRGFCYEEKVNIYRMLKTMKKMGLTQESTPSGIRPLHFEKCQDDTGIIARHFPSSDLCQGSDEEVLCNVKISRPSGILVEIKECKVGVLLNLLRELESVC